MSALEPRTAAMPSVNTIIHTLGLLAGSGLVSIIAYYYPDSPHELAYQSLWLSYLHKPVSPSSDAAAINHIKSHFIDRQKYKKEEFEQAQRELTDKIEEKWDQLPRDCKRVKTFTNEACLPLLTK